MHSSLESAHEITERQQREREYHKNYAAKNAWLVESRPQLDILSRGGRKWWNSHWRMYDALLALDLKGTRAVVPGCGFGDDACRLAELGADVYAFDISPEAVEIARQRAERAGYAGIHFAAMPAEQTTYASDFFDVAVLHGVFHHLSVQVAIQELSRIIKPGGVVISHDPYAHSSLQGLRNSRLIRQVIYPRMSRFIYGTDEPYITEDEDKLDERTVGEIVGRLSKPEVHYFCMAEGRVFPIRYMWASKLDRGLLRLIGHLGRYFGGRVVVSGSLRK